VTEVGSEADLLALVARAGQALLAQLDAVSPVSERAIRSTMPEDIEAARAYSEGLVALRANDAQHARDQLQRAISIDPTHAASHLALGLAWSLLGYDHRAEESARRALSHSGSLPREQRMSIEGNYYSLSHTWPRAIEIFSALYQLFPDTLEYGLQLAEAQRRGGQAEEALATIERMRRPPEPQRNDLRLDLARAWSLYELDRMQDMLAAARSAEQKARAHGDEQTVGMALHLEAGAYLNLHRCDKVKELDGAARAIAVRGKNLKGVGSATNGLAICLRADQDYAGSLRLHDEDIAILEATGNQLGLKAELTNSVRDLLDLGRASEAYARVERSLAIAREIDDQEGIINMLYWGALVRYWEGDWMGAKRALKESLALVSRTHYPAAEVSALALLARAQRAGGELAEARRTLDEALPKARQLDDVEYAAEALTERSDLLRISDELEEASAPLAEAKRLAQGAPIGKDVQAALSMTTAELELARGRAVEAEATMQVLLADPVIKDSQLKSKANEIRARSLLQRGQVGAAREALNRALPELPILEFAFRQRLLITRARAEAAEGHRESEQRTNETVLTDSERARFVEYQLEAKRARIELGQSVQDDRVASYRLATKYGFRLIARKMRQANGRSNRPD
jgi:hypothetical protein